MKSYVWRTTLLQDQLWKTSSNTLTTLSGSSVFHASDFITFQFIQLYFPSPMFLPNLSSLHTHLQMHTPGLKLSELSRRQSITLLILGTVEKDGCVSVRYQDRYPVPPEYPLQTLNTSGMTKTSSTISHHVLCCSLSFLLEFLLNFSWCFFQ